MNKGSIEQSENKNKQEVFSAGIYANPGLGWRAGERWIIDFQVNQVLSLSYLNARSSVVGPTGSNVKRGNSSFGFASSVNSNLLQHIAVGFRYSLKQKST